MVGAGDVTGMTVERVRGGVRVGVVRACQHLRPRNRMVGVQKGAEAAGHNTANTYNRIIPDNTVLTVL